MPSHEQVFYERRLPENKLKRICIELRKTGSMTDVKNRLDKFFRLPLDRRKKFAHT